MQKLLDIYSNGGFTLKTKFSSDNFTFGNMDKFGVFVHEDFKKRWFEGDN